MNGALAINPSGLIIGQGFFNALELRGIGSQFVRVSPGFFRMTRNRSIFCQVLARDLRQLHLPWKKMAERWVGAEKWENSFADSECVAFFALRSLRSLRLPPCVNSVFSGKSVFIGVHPWLKFVLIGGIRVEIALWLRLCVLCGYSFGIRQNSRPSVVRIRFNPVKSMSSSFSALRSLRLPPCVAFVWSGKIRVYRCASVVKIRFNWWNSCRSGALFSFSA